MGAALLNFLPGRMTFEQYFRWDGCSEDEMAVRFLIGLSPALLHRRYLVDRLGGRFQGPQSAVDADGVRALRRHRGDRSAQDPAQAPRRVMAAPTGVHFDAYRNRLVTTQRPGGNRHPLQRVAIAIARRQLGIGARRR